MSDINDAVEKIIIHKATNMKNNREFTKHIEDFLSEQGIDVKKEPEIVFKVCAVDAMIYDVGAALNFTRNNWTTYPKRKYILRKIFPKSKSKAQAS